MELSLEKNFENEKYENNIQMMDITKEGTNQDTQKKGSFNINEIKAYLKNNNYNNNEMSNDYPLHLITDINNNFSSRREDILKESIDDEDLVMNQSYNYNPNISHNSSKYQNTLQISKNNNENQQNFSNKNQDILFHSERKIFNPLIFPEISTKKSTKTSISIKDKDKSYILNDKNEEELDNKMNDFNYKDNNEENNIEKVINNNSKIKEKDIIKKQEESKNKSIESIKKGNEKNRDNYLEYKEYENNIIKKEDEELFNDEIEEDIFGKYVDNIIKRSYHVYTNRQCSSCANLLSKGKSCIKCPKYHHLIKAGKNL